MGAICGRAGFFELCNAFNLLLRSSLMTGGAKRGAPNPWLLEEPEETRGLGFDEIRQQQQKIIQGTKYPKGVGSEIRLGFFFYHSLGCSQYPLKIGGKTVGLRELLALLCLRVPGDSTDAVIHPGSWWK